MTKSYTLKLGASLAVALLACVVFSGRMLGDVDTVYMYIFYILLGFFCYCLSKYLGKEIYILVMIPRLLISANLVYDLFNLHPAGADMQNPFKIHPFTLVWFAIFVFELLEMLFKEDLNLDYLVIFGVLMVAVFCVITVVRRGGKGVSLLLDNYVGPVTFLLFFYMKRDISIKRLTRCMNILCAAIFLLALFGIIENYTHSNPFSNLFLTDEFYTRQTEERYRVMGTVGHIQFPIFMLAACFLVRANIKKIWLRIPIYVFLLFCCMLSQTRSIMVILLAYALLAEAVPFIRHYKGDIKRLVIVLGAAGLVVGASALAVMLSPLGQRLLARFASDSGSADARMVHLEYFFEHMFSMPLLGIGGFADNIVLFNEQGQEVIAEIPWINLYFELGIFFPLLLLFFFFILRAGKMKLELIALLIAFSPYTTLTGKTQCYYLFYTLAIYSIWLARAEKPALARAGPAPPLKQLFVPGRRLAPGICLGLAVCLVAGFGTWRGRQRVREIGPTYTASAELYVFVDPHNPFDTRYIENNMADAVQMHKYIADDIVTLAATPEFTEYMKNLFTAETGLVLSKTDYADRLSAAALYTSRIVRVTFTDNSAETAAEIANCYARALVAYAKDIMGYQFIREVVEAEVPLAPTSPRPVALTIISALFAVLVFLSVLLTLDLLIKAYRAYGKPLVTFKKRGGFVDEQAAPLHQKQDPG